MVKSYLDNQVGDQLLMQFFCLDRQLCLPNTTTMSAKFQSLDIHSYIHILLRSQNKIEAYRKRSLF